MKRADWRTPLSIPEAKVGDFAVQHFEVPAGKGVLLNSVWAMWMGGQEGPGEVVFPGADPLARAH